MGSKAESLERKELAKGHAFDAELIRQLQRYVLFQAREVRGTLYYALREVLGDVVNIESEIAARTTERELFLQNLNRSGPRPLKVELLRAEWAKRERDTLLSFACFYWTQTLRILRTTPKNSRSLHQWNELSASIRACEKFAYSSAQVHLLAVNNARKAGYAKDKKHTATERESTIEILRALLVNDPLATANKIASKAITKPGVHREYDTLRRWASQIKKGEEPTSQR